MEEAKVIEIIGEQLGISTSELDEDTVLADLGADSLDLFELVMSFEDEFDVKIPVEDLEQIKTVGDVVNYIKAHKE